MVVQLSRRTVTALVAAVLVLGLSACGGQQPPPRKWSDDYLRKGVPTPLPSAGAQFLGRPITSIVTLGKFIASSTTADCPDPKPAPISQAEFFLTDGMTQEISQLGMCRNGYGVVYGIVKPGRFTGFQQAYRQAVADDPLRWGKKSHRVIVGNGFFLITGDQFFIGGYGLVVDGMRFLRCGSLAENDRTTAPPADVQGCYFVRAEPSGT